MFFLFLQVNKKHFHNDIIVYYSFQESADVEAQVVPARQMRKRKTSQSDSSHGSFFLRIGAIGKKIIIFIIKQNEK